MADKIDFVLYSTRYRQPFYDFCVTEFSSENFDFCMAVEDYRASPTKDKAIKILDVFVLQTGARTVNLPAALSAPLLLFDVQVRALRDTAKSMNPVARILTSHTRKVEPTVFDAAQTHIRKLLGRDTLSRFEKITKVGKEMAAAYEKYGKQQSIAQIRATFHLEQLGHVY